MTEQNTPAITDDMTISDVVAKYPSATEVFLEYGLHCVGCHVAYWETIRQGAQGHGMTDEEIDMMIRDANAVISSMEHTPVESTDSDPIKITPSALNRIKQFATADSYFKIAIEDGGCAGQHYVFALTDTLGTDDIVLVKDGQKICVSIEDLPALKGCTVDYIDTLQEAGFKVYNPQAQTTCGCGSSFS
jgi:iron-sulfur cluster assembly accessory protein